MLKDQIQKARSIVNSGEIAGGQGTTEYALLIAFAVVLVIALIIAFGDDLVKLWQRADDAMNSGINESETVEPTPGG